MNTVIVVPHFIATEELKTLATNALKSMKGSVYLVSVDDGSPMDTTFLREYSDKVITLEKNSGFAKACNAGFDWALDQDFEFVGCANNDIEVFEGWLDALLEPFDKWNNTGITGITHDVNHKVGETFKGTKITEGGLIGDRMQNGGLWMSTKKVLLEAAPDKKVFDEIFEIGGEEDVDLFLRIRDKLMRPIIMSNKSVIWHKEGATRWNNDIEPGFAKKNRELEQKNYDKFAEKWGFDIRKTGLTFYEDVLEDGPNQCYNGG